MKAGITNKIMSAWSSMTYWEKSWRYNGWKLLFCLWSWLEKEKNRRKGREEFLIERGERTKYIMEFACVLLSSLHVIDWYHLKVSYKYPLQEAFYVFFLQRCCRLLGFLAIWFFFSFVLFSCSIHLPVFISLAPHFLLAVPLLFSRFALKYLVTIRSRFCH